MKFKDRIKGIVFGPWGRIYGTTKPLRHVPTIDSLLAKANSTRRVRLLDRGDIDAIIQNCRNAEDGHCSYTHGGTVASAYRWIARSTFALAAKIDNEVYVGITTMNAGTQGTPGAGWWELSNFTLSGPAKQMEKLRAWRDQNLNKTVVRVPSE